MLKVIKIIQEGTSGGKIVGAADISVESSSELSTSTDNYIFTSGSTAWDISTGDHYGLAKGVWIKQDGSKNLVPNTASSGTVSDVTFTVNKDGTVKANGTASAATWFKIADNLTLPAGKYVISGGEVVSGNVNVRVVLSPEQLAASIIADSNGASYTFTLNSETTANVYVRMSTGRTANNVLVKPMICTKDMWDISQEYVPFTPTNRELYEMILALQS